MYAKLIRVTLIASTAFLAGCSLMPSSSPTVYYPSKDFKSYKVDDPNARGTMRPYVVAGKTYYPTVVEVGDTAEGTASWYGPGFHGKLTSNGETYNQNAYTAAHKTLPMNTMLKVTNLRNHKVVIVRVNDRGPFVAGRIIDLSNAAARALGVVAEGTAPVKLEVISFDAQQAQAAKANEDLKKAGLPKNKQITFGEEVSTKTLAPIKRTYQGGLFLVQIGAFKNKEGAKRFANSYKSYRSYKGIVKESSDGLNRVYLSGFRSEAEARDFVRSGAFKGAFVVRQ